MMKLNRGINLGGYLSQCDHTLVHYETFITEPDIKAIADAGLDHVRLPIDFNVWENEDGSVKLSGYALTDRVIDWCKKYNLEIILDLHKACGYDFNDAGNAEKNNLFTNPQLQDRFVALWQRTAKRYGSVPHLAFELLNEVVEDSNAENWNKLIARTVNAIREYAPTAPIIYGGIQWNNINKLCELDPPHDENIIWTFHFYSPMPFTHQRAPWCPNIDQEAIAHYPDEEKEWTLAYSREMIKNGVECAKKNNVKLYCGEFGVISKAPLPDTLRWFKDADEMFREHGIGCAAWSYKQMDFGIFDKGRSEIFNELMETWTK